MKVIVTGATGLIGRRLVGELLSDGHEAVALTRNPTSARDRLPAGCACLPWDPATGPEIHVLDGADAIVHLAGEGVADGRWAPARKQAIRSSRVATTRALVAAAGRLPPEARPRVLVSASAVGYYGDRGDAVLDEASPPGNDFLAGVCQEWEQEALAASTAGLRTVVIRIGVVLGREGGALRKMLPPFRLGLGGHLGTGRQWMSWVHLEDLVRLVGFLLHTPAASGAINGVAPAPVTNDEFTRVLAQVLNRPAVLPVPAFALRLALGEMSTILLASQRVLPRAAERLGFQFRYPDLRSALTQLGEPVDKREKHPSTSSG